MSSLRRLVSSRRSHAEVEAKDVPEKLKVVIEYNPGYDRWYVWSRPTLEDRILLMSNGSKLFGSGRTREEAIADAQRCAAKELAKPNRHYEPTEIDL